MAKAGAWRRLVARIIDGFILAIPVVIVTAVVGGGLGVRAHEHHLARLFVGRLAGSALAFLYFVWMESQRGGTLGKDLMGLTVRSTAGGRLTPDQAARRNWWMWIGAIPLAVFGLVNLIVTIAIGVTIANDPAGRGFHDKGAGAEVDLVTTAPPS